MKFDFSYSRLSSTFGRCFHCINTVVALLLPNTLGMGMWDLVTPSRRLSRKQN